MEANNQRPPMWIRNNNQRQSRDAMLARMAEARHQCGGPVKRARIASCWSVLAM